MNDKAPTGPAEPAPKVASSLTWQAEAYTTPRPDVSSMVPDDALRVLDVGCSNGALGRSLKAENLGRRVLGIEYDANFAAQAATVLDGVVQADLNRFNWDLGRDAEPFDCLVFADVLEHLQDPADCLRQALVHLRPGGTVVVSLPNIRHLHALWSIFVCGRFPQRQRGLFDRTHLRWFTLADAANLLQGAGLAIELRTSALRWGDRGGGRINRMLNRMPLALQQWGPVREYLTYQVCFRGRKQS